MQQLLVKAQKNVQAILLAVATILGFLFLSGSNVQAAQLSANGAGADDAVVTDANGKNVTGQELNKYTYYNVAYKWSLPENTTVKAGDTVTFTLPSDVQIRVADTKFDVTDEEGHVVGEFEIAKNSSTGTLTFNDYFGKNNVKDIHGILNIKVNGTQENEANEWFLNKAGWLDSQNKPNWTIVYNPQSKSLTNVQIKDTLQNNQTYDVNSIQLWYGHVVNNQFVADQKVTNPVEQGLVKLSNNNTEMTVKFDKLDKAVQLVYQTNADTSNGEVSLVNNVDASCDQLGSATMTSTIEVGGDATAAGTQNASSSSSIMSSSSSANSSSVSASSSSNVCSSSSTTSSSMISSSSTNCRPNNPHRPCRPQRPCHPQHPCHPCHPQRPVCPPHCHKHHHHYFFNGVGC